MASELPSERQPLPHADRIPRSMRTSPPPIHAGGRGQVLSEHAMAFSSRTASFAPAGTQSVRASGTVTATATGDPDPGAGGALCDPLHATSSASISAAVSNRRALSDRDL